MKLFVIWPEKNIEIVNLLLELKKNSHEIVYWVGYDDSEMDKLPGTIFHSYYDALKALPAKNVDISEFSPPGEEIISKFYKIESLILTMMNRIVGGLGVTQRKRLYYEMLRYWLGVLKKYKPDLIIFPLIPHFAYDYLIYEIARELNIKTVMFLDTRIPGRLLFFNDFRIGSENLKKFLDKNISGNFSVNDLNTDFQKHYRKYTDKNITDIPPHIQFQRNKYSLINRFLNKYKGNFENFHVFKKLPYFFNLITQNNFAFLKKQANKIILLFKNNLKKEYIRLQSKADFSKKFIYVPLQVQPECSTSPQGDIFVDQILMLKTLAAALPNDWLIYVKEHPIQWMRIGLEFFDYKYSGYYKAIADIKNVRVVPIETNSYELINQSQAVSNISGAAGWEAILRSKPAIIFGYPWYKDCPEIFRVDSAESCRSAIKEIANGFKVDQQKVINYLKSLDLATIHGFIARSAGEGSDLTFEDSMKNITRFLADYLKVN